LERGLPVIVIRPHAETSPKLLGIAGETSFCADSLNFPHIDGTRQQLKGAQARARVDPQNQDE
jgi:hypothetical protein